MAKYTSQYPSLMFYVGGELKRFSSGEYNTDDKDEIAVLDGLIDAKRADEPAKPQVTKQPEASEQPAPKKAPTRKASAK